MQSGLSKDEH